MPAQAQVQRHGVADVEVAVNVRIQQPGPFAGEFFGVFGEAVERILRGVDAIRCIVLVATVINRVIEDIAAQQQAVVTPHEFDVADQTDAVVDQIVLLEIAAGIVILIRLRVLHELGHRHIRLARCVNDPRRGFFEAHGRRVIGSQ